MTSFHPTSLSRAWRDSHSITDKVQDKIWHAVKASCSGPPISHIFFADDLLLFAEATINKIYVMHCLETFCATSGQCINYAKSSLYCSANMPKVIARNLARFSCSPLVSDLGRYLGVPRVHEGPTT